MSFEVRTRGEFQMVVYRPWLERGIEHGFTLAPADFGEAGRARWCGELAREFGGGELNLLHQVHGTDIIGVEMGLPGCGAGSALPSGDAFVWREASGYRGIFGVKGADCAPILVCAPGARAAIHAGWRGLANGVIPRVLRDLGEVGPIECVIGPCAGPDRYEVGAEVIAAIGEGFAAVRCSESSVSLDVARTAAAQITHAVPTAKIAVSAINTVTDLRFHSHRRDRQNAGRGLGFFCV